jgi:hypothetical protein
VDSLIIESKFWRNFGSLRVLCKVITSAPFQGDGEYGSREQWLINSGIRSDGLFAKCMVHSLGTSSVPQVLLFSRTCFCASHGLTYSGRGGGCVQRRVQLHLSLHLPFMAVVTQVLRCELLFQAIIFSVGLFYRMILKFQITTNSNWCLWSIPAREGLRNSPDNFGRGLQSHIFAFYRSSDFP